MTARPQSDDLPILRAMLRELPRLVVAVLFAVLSICALAATVAVLAAAGVE